MVAERQRQQRLLTAKEVAAYLAVNQRTVYRLVKEKRIPAYKVGGQWRFKVEVLDACLTSGSGG